MSTKIVPEKYAASLEKLRAVDTECYHLRRVIALLQWDEETYLPEGGVEGRAEQLALLEGVLHAKSASKEVGSLLSSLGASGENPAGDEALPAIERDFLKVVQKAYEREVKLPGDFVEEAAREASLSVAAWSNAKKESKFSLFLPNLCKMLEISKKRAAFWGKKDAPYDALLDVYEPGMTADAINALFTPLRERLSAVLKKIKAGNAPDSSFLEQDFNVDAQSAFSKDLLTHIGFDTKRGRLDISAHPFTTSLGSDDVRITTRYIERLLTSSIFSTIHEAGHAFYEMSFPNELRASALAEGASYGIHESQSRFWENVVGRSSVFWNKFFPLLQSYFPKQLRDVAPSSFYNAVNKVEPSLIRTEADEVTYSLHVALRFEVEQKLISGALDPAKLPDAWRSLMKDYIGLEPPDDATGVLQDVHWAHGSFGYFPSYALGNLYGLGFHKKLVSDIPHYLEEGVDNGFVKLHEWLKSNIHVWGARLTPSELLKQVTGDALSAEPFLRYIEDKYAKIYGF